MSGRRLTDRVTATVYVRESRRELAQLARACESRRRRGLNPTSQALHRIAELRSVITTAERDVTQLRRSPRELSRTQETS